MFKVNKTNRGSVSALRGNNAGRVSSLLVIVMLALQLRGNDGKKKKCQDSEKVSGGPDRVCGHGRICGVGRIHRT